MGNYSSHNIVFFNPDELIPEYGEKFLSYWIGVCSTEDFFQLYLHDTLLLFKQLTLVSRFTAWKLKPIFEQHCFFQLHDVQHQELHRFLWYIPFKLKYVFGTRDIPSYITVLHFSNRFNAPICNLPETLTEIRFGFFF
eukprot:TRINITY_DN5324_c0_g2_i1.p1 TRINITY_DN5324_c0_g2~~TRINITY_DN5324_c0_g2_i1.p1  ORF type:complete len:138 (+),score=7.21 TRINITY_DN5324_c0_g2_i1:112-525(+)